MTEDPRLAQIAHHWQKGAEFQREADLMEYEQQRLQGLANEQEDKADELIDAVLIDRPDLRDALKWDRKVPIVGDLVRRAVYPGALNTDLAGDETSPPIRLSPDGETVQE